jgi:hypothetical protein
VIPIGTARAPRLLEKQSDKFAYFSRPDIDAESRMVEFVARGGNKFSIHVWQGRKRHASPGAPSFAFFAKGGIRERWYRDSWIPPFAKNAKDGAPGGWLHLLPNAVPSPLRVGDAGGD